MIDNVLSGDADCADGLYLILSVYLFYAYFWLPSHTLQQLTLNSYTIH